MILATPGLQIKVSDSLTNPPTVIMLQTGSVLQCPNGSLTQDITLTANSSGVTIPFPVGVTTAVFIYIAATTTQDLIVTVGATPTSISVPANNGLILYGLTSAVVTLNSVAGGVVQCIVGG